MQPLSSKSHQEISWMLDDYGIKHGPVVDTTRSLYEKKLREAMTKDQKSKAKARLSCRQNVYREEEEDVSYVHHPASRAGFSHREKLSSRSGYKEMEDFDNYRSDVYHTQTTYKHASQARPTTSRHEASPERASNGSGHLIPLWVQFLVFLLVSGFLYFIFINMESGQSNPFKRLN